MLPPPFLPSHTAVTILPDSNLLSTGGTKLFHKTSHHRFHRNFHTNSQQRILIVDASSESREILRLLLERKGLEAFEASDSDRASQLVQQRQPHLIIYDMDSDLCPPSQTCLDLQQAATRSNIPIVVLGTAKRPEGPTVAGQFVTKPYHYAPLIRRIEELLAECA
jgi:DNA-binding response OmpR family regulator